MILSGIQHFEYTRTQGASRLLELASTNATVWTKNHVVVWRPISPPCRITASAVRGRHPVNKHQRVESGQVAKKAEEMEEAMLNAQTDPKERDAVQDVEELCQKMADEAARQKAEAVEAAKVKYEKKYDDLMGRPLLAAIRANDEAAALLLLAHDGVDVNQALENGVTPLVLASENGHADVVKMLLAQDGVDVNHTNQHGDTPLFCASKKGYADVVEMLLAHDGVNVNQAIQHHGTPLSVASAQGHAGVVEMLLAQDGVDVNQGLDDGDTPLTLASENGHADVVEMLLAQDGVDVDVVGGDLGNDRLYWSSPIIRAHTNTEVVRLLLEAGADVNVIMFTDDELSTPLSIASSAGHTEMVGLLLEAGADVNNNYQQHGCGWTPLHAAIENGHADVIKMLLAQDGVDVNIANGNFDGTPLYAASKNGYADVVEMFLAHDGVDVNQDACYGTPLYVASEEGHADVVEMLLAHDGVDVNQANEHGETPLTRASINGHTDIMALLVFHGAVLKESDLPALRQHLGPFVPAIQNHMGYTTVVEMLAKGERDVHETDWTGLKHASVVARLVFHGAVPKESDLPSLRRRLEPFLTTMKTEYAAMLAFKTCLRGVGVGHALHGISINGEHPIRCIESYLLPCCRGTCFPLVQARRTILHLWVGEG